MFDPPTGKAAELSLVNDMSIISFLSFLNSVRTQF